MERRCGVLYQLMNKDKVVATYEEEKKMCIRDRCMGWPTAWWCWRRGASSPTGSRGLLRASCIVRSAPWLSLIHI